MHPIGVIHGRFQPLHLDHVRYILAGLAKTEFMYIGVTNPDPELSAYDPADPHRSATSANPCTYYERHLMVRGALLDAGYRLEQFCVVPFPINFPERWHSYVPRDATYFLTIYDDWGEKKLSRFESYGLATEVLWRRDPSEKGITGEDLRQRIRTDGSWCHLVPPATLRITTQFGIDARIRDGVALSPARGRRGGNDPVS